MTGKMYDFSKFNVAGAVTGRTTSDKANFTEVEKQLFPDAGFGEAPEESDEQDLPDTEDEEEDDDEELEVTPPDVVAMLGFDPKDEKE